MYFLLSMGLVIFFNSDISAQDGKEPNSRSKEIYLLIDNYALAREKKDTVLLRKILTNDIDQLVSTGEWRYGINEAIKGMLQSSVGNPGSRILKVEKVRFLDESTAIADAHYEIKNPDNTIRKMWSSFVAVKALGTWKIAAIRNMLPGK